MQLSSMEQIDRAALALLEALTMYGDEAAPYLEAGQMAALQQELISLRRALLGVQMGPLYWETSLQSAEAAWQQDR
ncbi:MAG: hypothetical protein IAE85_12960 [Anaerolinea sp.]|nr:hypothetical protein [Anaerolinea sp.]